MEWQNTMTRSNEYLSSLVRALCALPAETEWVEFKENQDNPETIGQTTSALANSAVLVRQPYAYLVWGIRDGDHSIVSTEFRGHTEKAVGNEDLEPWLLKLLSPRIAFRFFEVYVDRKKVILLEIEPAPHQPVAFKGQRYIRIGSTTRNLKDFPEKERALWRLFDRTPFEDRIAAEHVSDNEVLCSIDYPAYFALRKLPLPDNRDDILAALAEEQLIYPCLAGGWNVSNLVLVLFARQLTTLPSLRRIAIRVIRYRGNDSSETLGEHTIATGYASGFEDLIARITDASWPRTHTSWLYPEIAVRELIANALIHQDFFVVGSGPMVEIFEDRIEITNPGVPLVDIARSANTPPRSRNGHLVSFMRRFGICRALGSGWNNVATLCQDYQLPRPRVDEINNYTRVVLFAPRSLSSMDQ